MAEKIGYSWPGIEDSMKRLGRVGDGTLVRPKPPVGWPDVPALAEFQRVYSEFVAYVGDVVESAETYARSAADGIRDAANDLADVDAKSERVANQLLSDVEAIGAQSVAQGLADTSNDMSGSSAGVDASGPKSLADINAQMTGKPGAKP